MQIDDIATGVAPDVYTTAPVNPLTSEPGRRRCLLAGSITSSVIGSSITSATGPDEHPRVASVAGLTFFA